MCQLQLAGKLIRLPNLAHPINAHHLHVVGPVRGSASPIAGVRAVAGVVAVGVRSGLCNVVAVCHFHDLCQLWLRGAAACVPETRSLGTDSSWSGAPRQRVALLSSAACAARSRPACTTNRSLLCCRTCVDIVISHSQNVEASHTPKRAYEWGLSRSMGKLQR